MTSLPAELSGRFPITDVAPTVLGGRRPAAAVVGEAVPVRATAFREGHDALGVHAVLRRPDGTVQDRVRMRSAQDGLDGWTAVVRPDAMGEWTFDIEAWGDPWGTWAHRAGIKSTAGVDVEVEFEEGARLLDRAAQAHTGDAAAMDALRGAARTLRSTALPVSVRLAAASDPGVATLMHDHPIREQVTVSGPWPLRVQRRRALVGSWYEFFPRSEGATDTRSGTLRDAVMRLPAIAGMGFDVVSS